MSPDLAPLLKDPLLPIAIWVIGIGVGIGVERLRTLMRRRAWRDRNAWRQVERNWERSQKRPPTLSPSNAPTPTRPDAADQLRIVMGASFTQQPLLNKSELRVLKELERCVEASNPTWQVMAQVSLGEVLRSSDASAFACVNAKRVDLLLIDGECMPRHAIEYQGSGHYQGTAAARDAVKKEALRRAGIGYHEVVAGHTTPADLRRLVEKLVPKPAPTQEAEPRSLPGATSPWRPAAPAPTQPESRAP
jgi:hypothetical protein